MISFYLKDAPNENLTMIDAENRCKIMAQDHTLANGRVVGSNWYITIGYHRQWSQCDTLKTQCGNVY